VIEQWFEVLDGLLGKHWRNMGLFFNCTFLLFGSVIQLIACARYVGVIIIISIHACVTHRSIDQSRHHRT